MRPKENGPQLGEIQQPKRTQCLIYLPLSSLFIVS
jgi:hypothetical protein